MMSEKEIREELKEAYTITNLSQAPQKEHGYMYCEDDEREVEVKAYHATFSDGKECIIHVCPHCGDILDDEVF